MPGPDQTTRSSSSPVETRLDVGGRSRRATREQVELVVRPRQRLRQLTQPLGERVALRQRNLAQPPAARGRLDGPDQSPARAANTVERSRWHGHARFETRTLDVALETCQAIPADAAPEPVGRGVLDPVRLIEDDGRMLREDRRVELLANAEVGEVERMVDDHEIGLSRAPPRSLGEAHADERASPSRGTGLRRPPAHSRGSPAARRTAPPGRPSRSPRATAAAARTRRRPLSRVRSAPPRSPNPSTAFRQR